MTEGTRKQKSIWRSWEDTNWYLILWLLLHTAVTFVIKLSGHQLIMGCKQGGTYWDRKHLGNSSCGNNTEAEEVSRDKIHSPSSIPPTIFLKLYSKLLFCHLSSTSVNLLNICSSLSSLKLFSKEIKKKKSPKHLPNIAYLTFSSVKIKCLSQAARLALPGILYTFVSVVSNLGVSLVSVDSFRNSELLKDSKNTDTAIWIRQRSLLCAVLGMTDGTGSLCHPPLQAEDPKLTPDESGKTHLGLTEKQNALARTKMWGFFAGRGYVFARTQATEAGINKYKLLSGGQA